MQENYLLNHLGVALWYPRKLQHPWYKENRVIVEVSPAIFHVKCLVLLPMQKSSIEFYDPKVNKVLTGMLGVLDLTPDELSIAKIHAVNKQLTVQDWQQVLLEVDRWQPKFVLQLDKTAPLCCNDGSWVQTYHPVNLVQNPQDKAATYNDLLTLKNKILQ